MISTIDRTLASQVRAVYAQSGNAEIAFSVVSAAAAPETDSALADVIDADGRLRMSTGRAVTLDRYLDDIDDLALRTEPLDAAIDMTLRSLAHRGLATDAAIDTLVAEHPELAVAIREAATLNNAIWSTTCLKERITGHQRKQLPCTFGPKLDDGRPRYELQELLGEGAVGQVYLGVDRQLSEDGHQALVSIKIMPGLNQSEWGRQRLTEEATKARRITHANVVRVLDRGVSDDNEDFIVYEYVGGGDLGRHVRREAKISVRDAVSLCSRIARGVHAAHMAGIVHCDLKPNNIVLTKTGEPKVADFGVATNADTTASRIDEHASEPVGNLAFMSPEQYRMESGALTIPSDIYALGGMLFWLLTGRLPNGSTPAEIREIHDPANPRLEAPRLEPRPAGVDDDLEAVCRRALAASPSDRYASAQAFLDDLERWARHEPLTWRHPSAARRLRLWRRRKPSLAIAVGGLVVASLVGLVFLAGFIQVQQSRAQTRTTISKLHKQLRAAREKGLTTNLVTYVWLIEWITGPHVIGFGANPLDLWDMRIEVIEDLVAQAREEGRENELEPMLWEGALGFWYLQDKKPAAAVRTLDHLIPRLTTMTGTDDPWIVHLEAVRVCAEFNLGEHDEARLQELTAIVENALELVDERDPGTPQHRLLLEYLIEFYDTQRLEAKSEQARRRLDEVD